MFTHPEAGSPGSATIKLHNLRQDTDFGHCLFLPGSFLLFHPLTQGTYCKGGRRDEDNLRSQREETQGGGFTRITGVPQSKDHSVATKTPEVSTGKTQKRLLPPGNGEVANDLWEGRWGRSQLRRNRDSLHPGGGAGQEHQYCSKKSGQTGLYLEGEKNIFCCCFVLFFVFVCLRIKYLNRIRGENI